MTTADNFAYMDDPELIEARRGIRSQLDDRSPVADKRAELKRQYAAATDELDRRARIAWSR